MVFYLPDLSDDDLPGDNLSLSFGYLNEETMNDFSQNRWPDFVTYNYLENKLDVFPEFEELSGTYKF